MKRFQLSLNTTRTIFNGIKNISSYGYTEFTIIINDPPENGSCSILGFIKKDQKWLDTSVGLGLVQEFKLNCDNKWVDPNGHKILEYVFKSKWVIPREKKTPFLTDFNIFFVRISSSQKHPNYGGNRFIFWTTQFYSSCTTFGILLGICRNF